MAQADVVAVRRIPSLSELRACQPDTSRGAAVRARWQDPPLVSQRTGPRRGSHSRRVRKSERSATSSFVRARHTSPLLAVDAAVLRDLPDRSPRSRAPVCSALCENRCERRIDRPPAAVARPVCRASWPPPYSRRRLAVEGSATSRKPALHVLPLTTKTARRGPSPSPLAASAQ